MNKIKLTVWVSGAVLGLLLPLQTLQAAIFEPGFEVETVTSGLILPGSMAFTPDGRIFIAEKGGRVVSYKDEAYSTLVTLTDVNSFGDRGLLSIAVDPNFSYNGYIYLSYTFENSPGSNFSGEKTGRIVRLTVVGNTASESSKVVLVGKEGGNSVTPSCEDFGAGTDCIPSDSMSHSVGGLGFGPDGYLYATFGDGSNFDSVDPRALRAQNLDSLGGKVIRINTDGTAPASNPFYNGDPNSNRSKVFAYGVRNAFRFNFNQTTGALFLGDVGWSSWEEINLVTPGANFGWPCREGFFATEYNCAPAGTTDPKYAYGHNSSGAGSITAGAFPSNSAYPSTYDNSIFFGDYAQDWIKRAEVDGSNNITSIHDFMDNSDGPVAISTGPDGNIYFLSIYTGELHRITHTSGNRRPVVSLSANPTNGVLPLPVNFSSAGSMDPDGDTFNYNWNFGDGAFSTDENPSHTYTTNGNYIASLTLTDSKGSSAIKSITIAAGNQKPAPQITAPEYGALYVANQAVNLNAIATDPEDGTLPASAYHYQLIIHHNTHIHIIQEFTGIINPTFAAPDHGSADVYLEVRLTVTDSQGLSGVTSINMYPNTAAITTGNLIQNPSVETESAIQGTPQDWLKGGYGVNNAIFTYPVPGFEDSKAMKLEVNTYSSGNAKWYFNPVFVTPGATYEFSNHYTANVETLQVAQFGYSNGTYSYQVLGTLPATAVPTHVDRLITIPAGAQTFTLFHELDQNGILTVDDYSFALPSSTTPPTATSTNIFFGGFEADNFSEWDATPSANYSLSGGTCRMGPDSNVKAVKVTGANAPHDQTLVKSLSTAGYSNLSLSFCYKWDVLEAGDGLAIEYTADGSTWTLLKDINNSTVRHMMYAANDTEIADSNGVGEIPTPHNVSLDQLAGMSIAIPANASNNPAFKLRLREHMTDGNDFIWVDDFQIKGIATSTVPVTPPATTTTNLIPNPSFETAGTAGNPASWARGGWGTNTAVFTYPVTGTVGASAAKVEITNYTNGDAKWYFNPVNVTAGNMYNFSNSYRSNASTEVLIQYQTTAGVQYQYLATLPAATTWTNYQTQITVPANATALTVFHILHSVGYLETDNFSLTDNAILPEVSITSPIDNATVSGTIAVNATAGGKALEILGVQFILDGVNFGAEDTTAPYSVSLDTTTIANGAHILLAKARGDIANGTSTSSPIHITVNNAVTTTNLIQNQSLETSGTNGNPANWAQGGWGTNNRIFTYPVAGVEGAKAAKVEITSYTNGDAKWYFADVPVTAGAIYTYSNSYRSNVGTNVTVRYAKSDGTFIYQAVTSLPASTIWKSHSQTLVIPAGVVSLSVFHSLTAVGWLETDNFSLTTGTSNSFNKGMVSLTFDDGWLTAYTSALPILNSANMKGSFYIISEETKQAIPDERIQNPSLETAGTNGDPTNWFRGGWGTNNRVFTYPVAGTNGAKAAKVEITSFTNGDAKWYFGEATVIANQSYIIKDSYNSTASSEVVIRYTSTSGAVTYSYLATLPSTNGSWQNFERTVKVPADTASLTIFHVLPNVGSLTVDNYSVKRVQVFMDPAQMLQIQSSGHEIGSHTKTHPDLQLLNSTQQQDEISNSKQSLLNMGVINISTLAYPLGSYNSDIENITENSGYIGARSVDRGYNTKTTDKYALKIQQVGRTTTQAEVQGWIDQAAIDKTWLILMYHQVDSDMEATLGVTPAFLQSTVDYLGTKNVDVITVKQGISQMNP